MKFLGRTALLLLTVLVGPTVGLAAELAGANHLHPDFALLDADGVNVLDSGASLSTMKTCGQCHDTAYIESHAFHADLGLKSFAASAESWDSSPGLFGRWDPLSYRYLSRSGDERLDLSTPEWLMHLGERVVGGGPAVRSRAGTPLVDLPPDGASPESALLADSGAITPWDWAESGAMEMNCFLCHLEQPNVSARAEALHQGQFGRANTATLSGLNIVEAAGQGWTWNPAAFNEQRELQSRLVAIQDPTNANCAACHGEVHPATDEPLTISACDLDYPQTATTGQVIASQRINASGVNLAGKGELRQAWDIHAERQLQCTDCHHALNNPAHLSQTQGNNPAHLRYDPRSLEINEYLRRPDHNFARGQSAQFNLAPEYKGTMRRCENCHDAATSHQAWLPYVETHMAAMACETCHIPKLHAPAIQSQDWTLIRTDGASVSRCRGVEGPPGDVRSLVTGYQPVLLQRTNIDGQTLLAPYNLITSFYWVYRDSGGQQRPVRLIDLKAAFLKDGGHAPEIVDAFDADGDGRLSDTELVIDSPAKEQLLQARLSALGLAEVHIEGRVQPYSVNHNVVRGESALNDCGDCHNKHSRLTQSMPLADHAPVMPEFVATTNVSGSGELIRDLAGALIYQPQPAQDRLYIFGASRNSWMDRLGALAFAGTLFGVLGHGTLRYLAWRRRPHGVEHTRRVRMYDAYRRFWHWLQATSILVLLLTGLIIHRPDIFSVFSFRGVITLHNVLAVILVINAVFSLFYHLATERMREYIPRPHGFFDDSIAQTKYYLSGIFKGEPHPFEKRADDRMNPIQKLTYFGILNVLLPLQIATGVLIWGVQRWPELASSLGGLPLLASVHSLVAWLFASFIVGHVYLTTTGATPLEGIRGMVTGYEEVEDHPGPAK